MAPTPKAAGPRAGRCPSGKVAVGLATVALFCGGQLALLHYLKLDIGFIFASPLIFKENPAKTKDRYSVIDPIHFSQEAASIKEAVAETSQKIIFQSMVATISNFSRILNQKPRVLHISCHGIANNNQGKKEEGDYLLFEDPKGKGELVS